MTIAETNRFLACIARGWSISRAALEAGVSVGAVQEERKSNGHFAARWRDAFDAGSDRLEDVAAERAIHGTTKGVWYKGKLVGYEVEKSDSLLMFLIKGRRPAKYAHFLVGSGDESERPGVSGTDAVQWLNEQLAGLNTRSLTYDDPTEDSGEGAS